MLCPGLSDRVEFIPGDTRRLIAANAELDTCDKCNLSHVSLTVELMTEHIGKGCDRDTYSLESQRKLCGKVSPLLSVFPHFAIVHFLLFAMFYIILSFKFYIMFYVFV